MECIEKVNEISSNYICLDIFTLTDLKVEIIVHPNDPGSLRYLCNPLVISLSYDKLFKHYGPKRL